MDIWIYIFITFRIICAIFMCFFLISFVHFFRYSNYNFAKFLDAVSEVTEGPLIYLSHFSLYILCGLIGISLHLFIFSSATSNLLLNQSSECFILGMYVSTLEDPPLIF